MDCLLLEIMPLYDLRRLIGDREAASAERGWVRVEGRHETVFARAFGYYGVTVRPWFLKDSSLVDEVLKALDRWLEGLSMLQEAWNMLGEPYSRPEVLVCSDGSVRTLYGSVFTWFHGQEDVNRLLRPWGVQLRQDHDGITVIETRVGRPYTPEKLNKALKLIAAGVELYALILMVQRAEAVKTTLSYVARLLHENKTITGKAQPAE